jgi:hypothetical protein
MFPAALIDRARGSAEDIKAGQGAFAVLVIIMLAIPWIVLPQLYGERLAALENKLASETALVFDYRAKLQAASQRAAGQIDELSALVADLQNHLLEEKEKLAALERQPRDEQNLYEDNAPIARARDPRIDLAAKNVTFPSVTSGTLLTADKFYQYRKWKSAWGGSQSYRMIDDGAVPKFAYSHLICRIVGVR